MFFFVRDHPSVEDKGGRLGGLLGTGYEDCRTRNTIRMLLQIISKHQKLNICNRTSMRNSKYQIELAFKASFSLTILQPTEVIAHISLNNI